MTTPLGYDQFEDSMESKAAEAKWRLSHPTRRSVKIHATMHAIESDFARIPHGLRHTVLRPAFWLGLTLGFPLEHLLWEKAPIFSAITRWLGL